MSLLTFCSGGGGLVTKLCPTLVTPWTVACQAPLSIGFPRQECWSGLPFPSPGDLPNPGIEPRSPALQADSLPAELPGNVSIKHLYFFFDEMSANLLTLTLTFLVELHVLDKSPF